MRRKQTESKEVSIFDIVSDPGHLKRSKKTEARLRVTEVRKKIQAPYQPGSATDTASIDKWGTPKLLQFIRSLGPIYGVPVWMDSQIILVNTKKPSSARQAEFNQFLDILSQVARTKGIPQYAFFFDRWFANWEAQVIAFPGLAKAAKIGFQPKYWGKVFAGEGRQTDCLGTEIYNWVIEQESTSQIIKTEQAPEEEVEPEAKPFSMGNLDFLVD
jgi:hypothetical protein